MTKHWLFKKPIPIILTDLNEFKDFFAGENPGGFASCLLQR